MPYPNIKVYVFDSKYVFIFGFIMVSLFYWVSIHDLNGFMKWFKWINLMTYYVKKIIWCIFYFLFNLYNFHGPSLQKTTLSFKMFSKWEILARLLDIFITFFHLVCIALLRYEQNNPSYVPITKNLFSILNPLPSMNPNECQTPFLMYSSLCRQNWLLSPNCQICLLN